jgi:hypothetical protein
MSVSEFEAKEARRPTVETTAPLTYPERLRVAQEIVELLRSAGVTCGIFNGVQPMQCL